LLPFATDAGLRPFTKHAVGFRKPDALLAKCLVVGFAAARAGGRAPAYTGISEELMMGCVRAQDIVEEFPVVNIDSPALDAVRLLAEHQLNGLVVVTNTSETPYAILPASQVVRFIVPGYVQEDPGLAGVFTESMADQAAEKLDGKTIRDLLPKQRQYVPVVDADDTIIEVAELMARVRSPLVAVVKKKRWHGVITASRLLAAALKD
jgi:CBS domain-containing protein